jgi:hypothetical protein
MKENMKRYWTFTVIITLIVLVLGWLNGYNFGRAGGMSLANSLTEKFEQVTADQGASLREQETLINTCIEAANELLKQRQELYGQRQELLEHNQKLIEQLLMRFGVEHRCFYTPRSSASTFDRGERSVDGPPKARRRIGGDNCGAPEREEHPREAWDNGRVNP